jgi:hypothetical protein
MRFDIAWLAGALVLASIGACGGDQFKAGEGSGGLPGQGEGDGGDGGDVVAATGGTSSVDPIDIMEWSGACELAAEVFCARTDECAPFMLELLGGETVCRENYERDCNHDVALPGVEMSIDEYRICLDAFAAQTCDAWMYSRQVIPECTTLAGSFPDGSPCEVNVQCQSGRCGDVSINGCSTCLAVVGEGQACDVLEGPACEPGMECHMGFCRWLTVIGEGCSDAAPCSQPLLCREGQCSRPLGLGESCTSGFTCDLSFGLTCSAATSTCQQLDISQLGEPCDSFCSAGSRCNHNAVTPTCVAERLEGETCDDTGALPCASPLECIGGVCKQPEIVCSPTSTP